MSYTMGRKIRSLQQSNIQYSSLSLHSSLFQNIYYVIFYTLLMIPLGLHLHHGLKSGFKTLGFYHKKGLRTLAKVSLVYAVIMAVGFGVIPFIVYLK